ncbi:MAG: DUF2085 domain-containing protein [Ignavibacteria bacterium]|nr:DUF2085 domain-containing protein [Ignavibacteria bacterium]
MFYSQLNNTSAHPSIPPFKLITFRLLVFSLLFLWTIGILYPLLFNQLNNVLLEFVFKNLYSTVCHQQSEKSISFGNHQLMVCARCAGIYFGAMITAFAFFFSKRNQLNKKVLLISLAVVLVDVLLVFIGSYDYSKAFSLATGLIFGSTVYIYLMNELEQFLFNSKIYRTE